MSCYGKVQLDVHYYKVVYKWPHVSHYLFRVVMYGHVTLWIFLNLIHLNQITDLLF